MIVSKIQGGLANQIFQWAYGKYLSEKFNTPLYLDISSYTNQYGSNKREFSLGKFPYLEYNTSIPKSDNIQIISDNFHYSEINYNESYDYYLVGYWQTEKYFNEISDIIRDCLRPPEKSEIACKLPNGSNVSMHIRRTDYVTSNGYHPVQPISYYEKALGYMSYDNILVFSDDISWCKDNLKFDKMNFIEGLDNVEDMWLMSLCDNNIIANSSFSWWGAWLNSNFNKKVIAPLHWFGDSANLNTSDIIPTNWIRI